jgi:hypothetical protein
MAGVYKGSMLIVVVSGMLYIGAILENLYLLIEEKYNGDRRNLVSNEKKN